MRLLPCALLLPAVLAAQPSGDQFQTSRGAVTVSPIRHASLMIQGGGQVIYIDPAGQGDYDSMPQASLILVTDIHGDHLDPKLIARLRKADTVILAPEAATKQLPDAVVIRNGESKQIGDWKIEAVPAYNIQRGPAAGRLFHDKGRGNGYVLNCGGMRFYIAGDTEAVPEMKALKNIDVAFLPMNLPYTMPPEEAAEGAKAFKPKVVYPYHYRGSDLKAFEKALEGTGIKVALRDWYR